MNWTHVLVTGCKNGAVVWQSFGELTAGWLTILEKVVVNLEKEIRMYAIVNGYHVYIFKQPAGAIWEVFESKHHSDKGAMVMKYDGWSCSSHANANGCSF